MYELPNNVQWVGQALVNQSLPILSEIALATDGFSQMGQFATRKMFGGDRSETTVEMIGTKIMRDHSLNSYEEYIFSQHSGLIQHN